MPSSIQSEHEPLVDRDVSSVGKQCVPGAPCLHVCVCARVRACVCVCARVLSLHSCRVLAHAACWGLSFQARAAVRLDAAGGRGRALPMERLHHCHRVLFNQARWLRL